MMIDTMILAVDSPDPEYGISANGWDPKYNAKGGKKHLRAGVGNPLQISQQTLEIWTDVMFPATRSQPNLIHDDDELDSVPFTWSEFGITNDSVSRRKAHAKYAATTPAFAFLEFISLYEHGEHYR
ncbi:hypothetical protein IFR05_016682 [Cadophora sp. M221]|nr:hypothetical protein IFR05_016682 [Cadophora sp. M221]